MGGFDYFNQSHRQVRKCRTLAIKAALYAKEPAYSSVASSWTYIAQSWTDLADMKERMSRDTPPERPKPLKVSLWPDWQGSKSELPT